MPGQLESQIAMKLLLVRIYKHKIEIIMRVMNFMSNNGRYQMKIEIMLCNNSSNNKQYVKVTITEVSKR
jgi:hypothetical protein